MCTWLKRVRGPQNPELGRSNFPPLKIWPLPALAKPAGLFQELRSLSFAVTTQMKLRNGHCTSYEAHVTGWSLRVDSCFQLLLMQPKFRRRNAVCIHLSYCNRSSAIEMFTQNFERLIMPRSAVGTKLLNSCMSQKLCPGTNSAAATVLIRLTIA